MNNITRNLKKVVHFIGAAVKEGQNHYSGTELAPEIIRQSGLYAAINEFGWKVIDQGDVSIHDFKDKHYGPDYARNIYNINQLGDIMNQIHIKTRQAALQKCFALTVGGDHSVATGSIAGLKTVYPNLKVIWIDAHADCVIPEFTKTHYRNYHGMPVSNLMGWLSRDSIPNFEWMQRPSMTPKDICYIGIRNLEDDERISIQNFDMKYFTPDHISRLGIGEIMERTLKHLDADNCPIHISFDVDGIDPLYAPGTGTKVKEGLTYSEAMYICRRAAATHNLVGFDLVEINPLLEPAQQDKRLEGDNQCIQATRTVQLGCELVLACLGKKAMPFIK